MQLQSFLGAANYYHKFIPHYSHLTEPLRRLLKADSTWDWTSDCARAFNAIKEAIATLPVLAHFDTKATTVLTCDASGKALGAVLYQIQSGEDRPIAFALRSLSTCEQSYSTSEPEALACIWACEHWHYYLYGRRFIQRTDQQALSVLLSANGTGRRPMRLLRWADRLAEYDFDLQYKHGKLNSVADLFSLAGVMADLSDVGNSPKEELDINTVFGSQSLSVLQRQELVEHTTSEPILHQVKAYIIGGWPKEVKDPELHPYSRVQNELSYANGILYRGEQAVIPQSLQAKAVQLAHDDYPGVVRTKQL